MALIGHVYRTIACECPQKKGTAFHPVGSGKTIPIISHYYAFLLRERKWPAGVRNLWAASWFFLFAQASVLPAFWSRRLLIGIAFYTSDSDGNSLPIFSAMMLPDTAAGFDLALEASGLPTFWNLLHAITIITTLWVGWQFFLYRFATVGARWTEYWQKKPTIGFPLNSAHHLCMSFNKSKAGIRRAPAIVPAALSARRRSTTTMLSWFLGNATKIPRAFQKTFMCHWNNTSACKKYTKTSDFKSMWEQNPTQLVE